jgi:hypothetical protein
MRHLKLQSKPALSVAAGITCIACVPVADCSQPRYVYCPCGYFNSDLRLIYEWDFFRFRRFKVDYLKVLIYDLIVLKGLRV